MTTVLTILLFMMQGVSSLDLILFYSGSEWKFLSVVVQNIPKLGTFPISFPKLPRKRFLFSFNLLSADSGR